MILLAPSEMSAKDSAAVAGESVRIIPQVPKLQVPVVPLDFSDVTVKRKNQHDAGVQLEWDANTGQSTALALEPFKELCSVVGTATTTAPYLDIHLLQDGSGDITGVPSGKKGKNTLAVRWSKGGEAFRIDFTPLFLKRPFNRPPLTRAYIPLEFTSVAGVGPCVIIRFSRVEFSRIEVGSRPRKKKAEEPQKDKPDDTEAKKAE